MSKLQEFSTSSLPNTTISTPKQRKYAAAVSGANPQLPIFGITWKDHFVTFRNTLFIAAFHNNGHWEASMPSLGVDVWAESEDELASSLREELEVLFEQYAEEPDENLTASAQNLKSRLNALLSAGE